MSIQNSMVRHTLLLSLASIWMRGVSMLFQLYLSRRMGAAGVGLLQLISTVGMLAATVGTAGVRVAAMYLAAEERGRRNPGGIRRVTGCCLRYGSLVSSVAATTLFFTAPWISVNLLQAPEAAASLRLFALFLPVSCLCAVLAGWFTACVKIKQLTLVEVSMQIVVLAMAALFLSLAETPGQCCCAIMLANGLGDLGMLAILFALYRRQSAPPDGSRVWRRLLKLCLPLALSDILRSGLAAAEQLLIPRGLAAAGLGQAGAMAAYGAIHGMVFPVIMFPATLLYALADLLVPELARCDAAGSRRRIRYLTSRCLKLGLLYACMVAGLMWCLALPLARLLYGQAAIAGYLQLFAPLILMLYLDAIVDAMLKGLGQQVASVRYNILTSALDIVLLLYTLPRWGLDGYFWSFTITHGLNFLLSICRLLRTGGLQPGPVFCLKAIAAAVVAAVLCHVVSLRLVCPAAGLLPLIGYPVLFLMLCFFWGALRRQDADWLRHLIGLDASRPKPYTEVKNKGRCRHE